MGPELFYMAEIVAGFFGAIVSAACLVTILVLMLRYRRQSPGRKSTYRVVIVAFAFFALIGWGFAANAWPIVEGIRESDREFDYYRERDREAGVRRERPERLLTPDEVRAETAAAEAELRAGWARADQRRATLKEAESVVLAWNDALDSHDAGALEGLYAEEILFYGKSLSRRDVMASKRAALSAKSTFHQQIVGEVWTTMEGDAGDAVTAKFEKRSGSAVKLLDAHARLGLERNDGGTFVIAEETDDVTQNP